MPAPVNAPLPPFFTLTNGYTVRVTAQNPTTGATVSTVIASNVSLAVDQRAGDNLPALPPLSPAYLPA